MNLPEWLEIQRINQALPFADPIQPVLVLNGREFVTVTPHWRYYERWVKRLRKFDDEDFRGR
jgi:hypothetical protein